MRDAALKIAISGLPRIILPTPVTTGSKKQSFRWMELLGFYTSTTLKLNEGKAGSWKLEVGRQRSEVGGQNTER